MSEPDADEDESVRFQYFHAKNPAIEHTAKVPIAMPAIAPLESPVEVGLKIWYTSPDPGGEFGGENTLHKGALGSVNDSVKPGMQYESIAVPSVSGNEARAAIGNWSDGLQSPETGSSRIPN